MTNLPILSLLIFLPAVAAFIVPVLRGDNAVRWFTFLALLADFLIATWFLRRCRACCGFWQPCIRSATCAA